jgi:hypothetical protein
MFELLSVFWAFPGASFFLITARYSVHFASVLLFQKAFKEASHNPAIILRK